MPGGEGVGDAHVLSQAIVELGRALSLDMIVEGIETQDQADWFRTLGCRLGQGYHYARPMAAPDSTATSGASPSTRVARPRLRRGRLADGTPGLAHRGDGHHGRAGGAQGRGLTVRAS